MTQKKHKQATKQEETKQEPDLQQQDAAEPACEETVEQDEKFDEQIKTLEAERDEYVNALIRERADFENYKKRNADLSANSYQNGVADAATAMLPVIDNFERALAVECEDKAFVEGVGMIMRQICEALKNLGVEEIKADGQFDPAFHNAVMQVEEDGREPNSIVEVLQKGYILKGRVLRHSMVKVAK
ncbi:MAG: nucleotide exchange factor GrpE [Christensenella sp.]|uniref:nucleotide exchange factor GrpE n=1 Tax=Christensenella sp. TaxID=1935934 RepID=UPI002B220869|nr:nucleotide exchange factor GrpE [Christensenella sp.]MEA5003126.1 nucleotide exchange factor GrpE [Christensenella sp.]